MGQEWKCKNLLLLYRANSQDQVCSYVIVAEEVYLLLKGK